MPDAANHLTAAQLARPLRVGAGILTLTSLSRGIIDLFIENGTTFVIAVRVVQVLAMIVLTGLSTPRQSVRGLQNVAIGVALVVPLANLMVARFDLDEMWPTVTIVVAVLLGAALFVPWSWRRQAVVASVLCVATLITTFFIVPRSVFSWADVALSTLFVLATGGASVLGVSIANRERARVLASEAQYRSLFESAGDAIAVLDADGVIKTANTRLAALLGRPLTEIVGRSLDSFRAGAVRGGAAASTEHLAALTGQLQRGRHTFVHSSGRQIEVEVSYARTEEGVTPLVQAIVHDLTEQHTRQRSEIKDQRLDALGQLAGGIAHQFNNVLGGIMTHASVLREDAANAASAKELDEILTAARRGRELTQELLRFTKSEPLKLRATAPGLLLESVAALARSSLPDGITVEVRAADDVPALQGDPDHLVHACLELVLNARDAMQGMEGGRLTLAAATEEVAADDNRWPGAAAGRYVRLSVTDTGRGMDAATRDRAFEPFFTTKPMHRAAGIGLPKVQGVVRDHRGAIRVDSAVGRGTTVHVLVPVSKDAAAVPAAPTPVAVPAGPATILVVDDEAIVRHSLRRALTKFGYRVLEAGDGPSALAQLQSADPPVKLVILDLVLPGGGAGILELLRAIRPDLKVLVSSGYSPETDTVKDLVRRVEGFLPKPYEMAELRAAVSKALAS